MSVFDRSILITNGNLGSMIALADWMAKYGHTVRKVYVTHRLPSTKNNVSGFLSLVKHSGLSYSWFKLWLNKVAPMELRARQLPGSVHGLMKSLHKDISFSFVDDLKRPEVLADMRAIEPELIVSFSATQRFSDDLISIPSHGAVNVHYGALPRYAGLSPYYWHLHNREPSFGVTLHRIESRLDSGGVIEQAVREVGAERTCLGLMLKMASEVSPLLCRLFSGESGLDRLDEQDISKRSYFGHPTRHQVRDFKRNGFSMMDSCSKKELFSVSQDISEKLCSARASGV
ncbi:formyltransferase family protein [Thioalkalivibrio versutus]|uniref:formyltransferase family protein n=1 Tax=Thioalkalivibrio versutus TaxID=106634 RepID=UPI00118134CF|nr:formyltransferase family protein [Thioalkalivibrio versutus]